LNLRRHTGPTDRQTVALSTQINSVAQKCTYINYTVVRKKQVFYARDYLRISNGDRDRCLRPGWSLRRRSSRYDALSNTRHVPTNLLAGAGRRLL